MSGIMASIMHTTVNTSDAPEEFTPTSTFDVCLGTFVTASGVPLGQDMMAEGSVFYKNSIYEQRAIIMTYNTTTSTTAAPVSTAVPGVTVAPASTSSTLTPTAQASTGLSTGAKAGISVDVGVTLGAHVIIAGIVLYVLRRLKKGAATDESSNDEYGKPELHGDHVEKHTVVNEVDAGVIHEMPADSRLVEMQGNERVV
jgi:hypothetical protein